MHTFRITNPHFFFFCDPDSGELYTWGKNTSGQLGHGPTAKLQTTPKRVDALRGVVVAMVSCGGEHTVIADQTHAVYSWGDGKFGQLGT